MVDGALGLVRFASVVSYLPSLLNIQAIRQPCGSLDWWFGCEPLVLVGI